MSGMTCGAQLGTCGTASCGGGGGGGPCGGAGQACCVSAGGAADFCTASGLTCARSPGGGGNNTCQQCGGAGQPCCDGNVCGDNNGCCDQNTNTCVANGGTCSANQGTCTSGGCMAGACGKAGQAVCGGGVNCTAAFTTDDNGACVPCGGVGEPCCPGRGGDFCGAPYACGGGGGGNRMCH
jgi:hypothetical protein